MLFISEHLTKFLTQVGRDRFADVAPVPKSVGCGEPGDFLMFYYRPKYPVRTKKGELYISPNGWRIVLITQPVVKSAKTGNILLTGFDVPEEGDYTPESLVTLYTNKELSEDSYRTYILSEPHTAGSMYRITR